MYSTVQSLVMTELGDFKLSYGLICGALVIEDISTDKAAIEALAELCTKLELSPLHLRDVVEDFLAR